MPIQYVVMEKRKDNGPWEYYSSSEVEQRQNPPSLEVPDEGGSYEFRVRNVSTFKDRSTWTVSPKEYVLAALAQPPLLLEPAELVNGCPDPNLGHLWQEAIVIGGSGDVFIRGFPIPQASVGIYDVSHTGKRVDLGVEMRQLQETFAVNSTTHVISGTWSNSQSVKLRPNMLEDADSDAWWAGISINQRTGSVGLQARVPAGKAAAELNAAAFRAGLIWGKYKRKVGGVIAIGSEATRLYWTGSFWALGNFTHGSQPRWPFETQDGFVFRVEIWPFIQKRIRINLGSAANRFVNRDFVSQPVEGDVSVIIKKGDSYWRSPTFTDQADPYDFVFTDDDDWNELSRFLGGSNSFLSQTSHAHLPGDWMSAIIYNADWNESDDLSKAFDDSTFDANLLLETGLLEEGAFPITGVSPSESDDLKSATDFARYCDVSSGVDLYWVDSRKRCSHDPVLNPWVPEPKLVPSADVTVYCRTRGSHIVPPAIHTTSEQRARGELPAVPGCLITTEPLGTDPAWPAEFYATAKWDLDSQSLGEYSAWHIGNKEAPILGRVDVSFPNGSRYTTGSPYGLLVVVRWYLSPGLANDGSHLPVKESDLILTFQFYVELEVVERLKSPLAVSGGLAIKNPDVATILPTGFQSVTPGPAAPSTGVTLDNISILPGGSFTASGVETSAFIVGYDGRFTQILVSNSSQGTALSALAAPTLTVSKTDGRVTLTVSDVPGAATHWEWQYSDRASSTDNWGAWISGGVAQSKSSLTDTDTFGDVGFRRYQARVTGPNNLASSWSTSSTVSNTATTVPIIDEIDSFGLMSDGQASKQFQLSSEGTAPYRWTLAHASLPPIAIIQYDADEQPILQEFTGTTTASPIARFRMPKKADIVPKLINIWARREGRFLKVSFIIADEPTWGFRAMVTDSLGLSDTEDFAIRTTGHVNALVQSVLYVYGSSDREPGPPSASSWATPVWVKETRVIDGQNIPRGRPGYGYVEWYTLNKHPWDTSSEIKLYYRYVLATGHSGWGLHDGFVSTLLSRQAGLPSQ